MSCFELAKAAVLALKAHVEGTPAPKREYPIETRLVVRESTGFPRGAMQDLRKSKSAASGARARQPAAR
jgi:LacI family transcriptional regulator